MGKSGKRVETPVVKARGQEKNILKKQDNLILSINTDDGPRPYSSFFFTDHSRLANHARPVLAREGEGWGLDHDRSYHWSFLPGLFWRGQSESPTYMVGERGTAGHVSA